MSDEFEKLMQEKINTVACALIERYPEIAKSDPKRIGRMAKDIVFNLANIAIDIINEEQKKTH